jgi:hypothetical protein
LRWLFALAAATLVLAAAPSARAQFVNWRNVTAGTSARAVSVTAPRLQLLNGRGGMFASSVWVVDSKFNILASSPWAYWSVAFDDAITNGPFKATVDVSQLRTRTAHVYTVGFFRRDDTWSRTNVLPVGDVRLSNGVVQGFSRSLISYFSGRTFGFGAAAYGLALGETYSFVFDSSRQCLEWSDAQVMTNGAPSTNRGCAVFNNDGSISMLRSQLCLGQRCSHANDVWYRGRYRIYSNALQLDSDRVLYMLQQPSAAATPPARRRWPGGVPLDAAEDLLRGVVLGDAGARSKRRAALSTSSIPRSFKLGWHFDARAMLVLMPPGCAHVTPTGAPVSATSMRSTSVKPAASEGCRGQ